MRIIIGLLTLISFVSFGQESNTQLSQNERIIGKCLIDNSDIKGVEYKFSDHVYKYKIDTNSNLLTVQLIKLSNNSKTQVTIGEIRQYDLDEKKLLWSKEIDYLKSRLIQTGNKVIFNNGNKSQCLNAKSGNIIWEIKKNIYYIDTCENIGIGSRYNKQLAYINKLEGIDLKNGNVVWKRVLNLEYGLNDIFYLNDSILIVLASGLHTININNGEGWDYKTITCSKDLSGKTAANSVGLAIGLLTGILPISYNIINGLVSNCLSDSTCIYFASKERLVKINKSTGEIIWKYPFPENMVSNSSIFILDSLVFMINKGYAFIGNKQLNYGRPFIAAFDKSSGRTKHSLIFEEKEPILDFKLFDDMLFLIFKNKIEKFSLKTGKLIHALEIAKENFNDLKRIFENQIYTSNPNGDFINIHQKDSSILCVLTDKRNIIFLDEQLNIVDKISLDDLGFNFLQKKYFKFIANANKTIIINNSGKRIAELEVSSNSYLYGKTLIDIKDNQIVAIDLKNIFNYE